MEEWIESILSLSLFSLILILWYYFAPMSICARVIDYVGNSSRALPKKIDQSKTEALERTLRDQDPRETIKTIEDTISAKNSKKIYDKVPSEVNKRIIDNFDTPIESKFSQLLEDDRRSIEYQLSGSISKEKTVISRGTSRRRLEEKVDRSKKSVLREGKQQEVDDAPSKESSKSRKEAERNFERSNERIEKEERVVCSREVISTKEIKLEKIYDWLKEAPLIEEKDRKMNTISSKESSKSEKGQEKNFEQLTSNEKRVVSSRETLLTEGIKLEESYDRLKESPLKEENDRIMNTVQSKESLKSETDQERNFERLTSNEERVVPSREKLSTEEIKLKESYDRPKETPLNEEKDRKMNTVLSKELSKSGTEQERHFKRSEEGTSNEERVVSSRKTLSTDEIKLEESYDRPKESPLKEENDRIMNTVPSKESSKNRKERERSFDRLKEVIANKEGVVSSRETLSTEEIKLEENYNRPKESPLVKDNDRKMNTVLSKELSKSRKEQERSFERSNERIDKEERIVSSRETLSTEEIKLEKSYDRAKESPFQEEKDQEMDTAPSKELSKSETGQERKFERLTSNEERFVSSREKLSTEEIKLQESYDRPKESPLKKEKDRKMNTFLSKELSKNGKEQERSFERSHERIDKEERVVSSRETLLTTEIRLDKSHNRAKESPLKEEKDQEIDTAPSKELSKSGKEQERHFERSEEGTSNEERVVSSRKTFSTVEMKLQESYDRPKESLLQEEKDLEIDTVLSKELSKTGKEQERSFERLEKGTSNEERIVSSKVTLSTEEIKLEESYDRPKQSPLMKEKDRKMNTVLSKELSKSGKEQERSFERSEEGTSNEERVVSSRETLSTKKIKLKESYDRAKEDKDLEMDTVLSKELSKTGKEQKRSFERLEKGTSNEERVVSSRKTFSTLEMKLQESYDRPKESLLQEENDQEMDIVPSKELSKSGRAQELSFERLEKGTSNEERVVSSREALSTEEIKLEKSFDRSKESPLKEEKYQEMNTVPLKESSKKRKERESSFGRLKEVIANKERVVSSRETLSTEEIKLKKSYVRPKESLLQEEKDQEMDTAPSKKSSKIRNERERSFDQLMDLPSVDIEKEHSSRGSVSIKVKKRELTDQSKLSLLKETRVFSIQESKLLRKMELALPSKETVAVGETEKYKLSTTFEKEESEVKFKKTLKGSKESRKSSLIHKEFDGRAGNIFEKDVIEDQLMQKDKNLIYSRMKTKDLYGDRFIKQLRKDDRKKLICCPSSFSLFKVDSLRTVCSEWSTEIISKRIKPIEERPNCLSLDHRDERLNKYCKKIKPNSIDDKQFCGEKVKRKNHKQILNEPTEEERKIAKIVLNQMQNDVEQDYSFDKETSTFHKSNDRAYQQENNKYSKKPQICYPWSSYDDGDVTYSKKSTKTKKNSYRKNLSKEAKDPSKPSEGKRFKEKCIELVKNLYASPIENTEKVSYSKELPKKIGHHSSTDEISFTHRIRNSLSKSSIKERATPDLDTKLQRVESCAPCTKTEEKLLLSKTKYAKESLRQNRNYKENATPECSSESISKEDLELLKELLRRLKSKKEK